MEGVAEKVRGQSWRKGGNVEGAVEKVEVKVGGESWDRQGRNTDPRRVKS